MVVYCVEVYVNAGFEKEFEQVTEQNHLSTVKEAGCIRFDLCKSTDTEGLYFLYEVYKDEDSVAAHKETEHYLTWRETVEPWMEKKRYGRMFDPVCFTE